MSEAVIGNIYPAALIGSTPLFGNIYIPYRLILTSERVIAFYPDAAKTFRSGLKMFKAREYSSAKWKELLDGLGNSQIVFYGKEGISENMLEENAEYGYGSLPYDKIGGVMLKKGLYEKQFNILFRPAEKVLVKGFEFCTPRSALEEVKALLGKTSLSNKVEAEI